MSEHQRSMMLNAIGRPVSGAKTCYRNRFLAGPDDLAEWVDLVKRGYAKESSASGWFYVSPAGFEALGFPGCKESA